jgi:hypothetical protein
MGKEKIKCYQETSDMLFCGKCSKYNKETGECDATNEDITKFNEKLKENIIKKLERRKESLMLKNEQLESQKVELNQKIMRNLNTIYNLNNQIDLIENGNVELDEV